MSKLYTVKRVNTCINNKCITFSQGNNWKWSSGNDELANNYRISGADLRCVGGGNFETHCK